MFRLRFEFNKIKSKINSIIKITIQIQINIQIQVKIKIDIKNSDSNSDADSEMSFALAAPSKLRLWRRSIAYSTARWRTKTTSDTGVIETARATTHPPHN